MEILITFVPALITSFLCWYLVVHKCQRSHFFQASLIAWLSQSIIYAYLATGSNIVHGIRLSYFIKGYVVTLILFHSIQTIHWEFAEHPASRSTVISALRKVGIDLIHLIVVISCVNFSWSLMRGNIFGWL